MADELLELKNYFYLGNLNTAIQEGETVSIGDQRAQIERDVILKRIALAKREYDSIIQTVTDQSPPAMHVIKLLAMLEKDVCGCDQVSAELQALANDDVASSSPCVLLLIAIAYAHLGDFDNALRAAHRAGGLDGLSVKVQVLIMMDRVDVAVKEVAAMQGEDEDATLTQLAMAWTHLAKGEDSVQEALYIYQDLLERHGATDQILNGMAVCHLALGKPDESERVLKEALTKNPSCELSLVNVICSSQHKNKPAELVNRYFTQLSNVAPSNTWLKDYKGKESEFDELAQEMTVV